MAGTRSQELMEMEHHYGAHNYHPLEVVIAKAQGIWVEDPEGKRYMDMLSAYSAVNQGHRHPKIIQALKDQADVLTLTSRAFFNDRWPLFAKKLSEMTGKEMILPMNTGVETFWRAIMEAPLAHTSGTRPRMKAMKLRLRLMGFMGVRFSYAEASAAIRPETSFRRRSSSASSKRLASLQKTSSQLPGCAQVAGSSAPSIVARCSA